MCAYARVGGCVSLCVHVPVPPVCALVCALVLRGALFLYRYVCVCVCVCHTVGRAYMGMVGMANGVEQSWVWDRECVLAAI